MKVPSRKVLIGIAVALTVIILLLIVIISRRRSRFVWPVASGTPDTSDTALSDQLSRAQEVYNRELIRISGLPASERPAATLTAEQTFSTSVASATNTFVNGKCPDVLKAQSGLAPTNAANQTAWNQYQTDIASIQDAYYTAMGSATASTTPTSNEVIAARKADLSGATRKYIATICPSFYTTDSGTPPPPYASWSYVASGTAPSVGVLGTNVTTANINTWATKAAKTTRVNNTNGYALLAGVTTTGALTVDDSTIFTSGNKVQLMYQALSDIGAATRTYVTGTVSASTPTSVTITLETAVPSGGVIIPNGTVIATGLRPDSASWYVGGQTPNWTKARDYGPGSYPTQTYAA